MGIRSCKNNGDFKIKLFGQKNIETSEPIHKVYIDPGHGGSDPGTEGTTYGTMEKDVNLKVAIALNDLLLAENYQTYMTRVDDSTVKVWDRPEMVNETDAEIFVSIHFNAVEKQTEQTSGIQTFYYELTESDSPKLAKNVHESLIARLSFEDRGIIGEDHCVTRETKIPAILLELGFLSNEKDETFYLDDKNIKKAAEAIKDGILKYFQEKESDLNDDKI